MFTKKILKIILLISFFLTTGYTQESYISKVDTASKAMVVAAHPLAAKIGVNILQKGGNAIDAAVAMAFAIGVVEPHASGLGGGGGMLIYLKEQNTFKYLDYYVQAPQNPDYTYSRKEGVATARAICIPGTPSGLLTALEKFGQLPAKDVLAPAIQLAKKGIVVNSELAEAILEKLETIMTFPQTQNIFFNSDGLPLVDGDTLKNDDLYAVLKNLVLNGKTYCYQGPFAQKASELIKKLNGTLTYDDFSNYKTLIKNPLITDYNGFKIISAPPPQSGLTLLEILNIVELIPDNRWKKFKDSPFTVHFLIEAIKRADADRFQFLGDPRFFDIPVSGLIDKNYARTRFEDIDPERVKYSDNFDISPGKPSEFQREKIDFDIQEGPHTTHISVVDEVGNVVTLTQTLGLFFGSGFSSEGVVFNSSMSLFYKEDLPNKLEAGKRPASTICPTIIMKDGQLYAVLGTPGGPNIFNTMAEVIIRLIDFQQSPIEAVDAPRFSPRITRKHINFEDRYSKQLINDLQIMGHHIRFTGKYNKYMGGVQLIFYDQNINKYIGVSDPRRAGAAEGLDK